MEDIKLTPLVEDAPHISETTAPASDSASLTAALAPPRTIAGHKARFTLEQRQAKSAAIRLKYPNRIPVFVECRDGEKNITVLDKCQLLFPSSDSVSVFLSVIRKRISLTKEQALFVFIGNRLMPGSSQLGSVYDDYKDEDGYLYVTYSGENTFGF